MHIYESPSGKTLDLDALVPRKLTDEERAEEEYLVRRCVNRLFKGEENAHLREELLSMLLGTGDPLPEEELEPQVEKPKRKRGEKPPCGTYEAYNRHTKRGEYIDEACKEAGRRHRAARKARLYREATRQHSQEL